MTKQRGAGAMLLPDVGPAAQAAKTRTWEEVSAALAGSTPRACRGQSHQLRDLSLSDRHAAFGAALPRI
jgi:hypothetical protein